MKRIFLLLLCIIILVSCIACASKAPSIEKIVDKEEADIYNSVFLDGDTAYDNKEMTKTGTFTILYDTFNDVERYYVWGYENDEHTSGWQWEFTVDDLKALPKPGSQIKVAGKFVANDDALDKKWIEKAVVTVESEYNDSPCKYDLTTMSPILSARVQVPNIQNDPSAFADDSICIYGIVGEGSVLKSPYEELGWTLPVASEEKLPEAGSYITAIGNYDEHGHFMISEIYTK